MISGIAFASFGTPQGTCGNDFFDTIVIVYVYVCMYTHTSLQCQVTTVCLFAMHPLPS